VHEPVHAFPMYPKQGPAVSVLTWMTISGALLLFMALTSSAVQRLPISTACIYLVVGLLLGPGGAGLFRLNIEEQRGWMEVLTECAVIVSLFVGGLRLRLPLRHPTWRRAVLLAGPVMLLSIVGIAAVAHLLLGMPLLAAVLLGAVLAPTDPVLAAAVSVNDSQDHDRVRFGLSGEAGLNDGAAFPFVVLALEGMRRGSVGPWLFEWFGSRVLWAVPAGLIIGYAMGLGVGRLAMRLRSRNRDMSASSDFMALALIALAYVAAERVHAWGFLAVFAAGVGLRNAEVQVVRSSPHPHALARARHWLDQRTPGAVPHPPAETLVSAQTVHTELEQPAVAAGVVIAEALTFGHTLERLLEVLLVVLVGIALTQSWQWSAVLLAALLLLIIRPASTALMLRVGDISLGQRRLMGWFGIRGIGSLYYLSYALNHGVPDALALPLVQLVVTVIACSIVVHGITVTPVLAHYERGLARGAHPA
jgi:sodium/hydrogen antiporter